MAGHGDGGRSESHPDQESRPPSRDSRSSSRVGDYERPELKPENSGDKPGSKSRLDIAGLENPDKIEENLSADKNKMDPPTEGFKNEGRGSKTIESASFEKAQKMVDEWREKDLPGSRKVTAEMLVENFPAIKRETRLERDIDRMTTISMLSSKLLRESNVPPELGDMVLSDVEKDPDRMALKSALSSKLSEMSNLPPEFKEMMTGKWEGKIREMQKEREFLKTTFPENPTQVLYKDMARRWMEPNNQSMGLMGQSFDQMAIKVWQQKF